MVCGRDRCRPLPRRYAWTSVDPVVPSGPHGPAWTPAVPSGPQRSPAVPSGPQAADEYRLQYKPPREGHALVGWRIKATFPTGPRDELRWHDGFIIECKEAQPENGRGLHFEYRAFIPVDACDIKLWPPFDDKFHLLLQVAPLGHQGERSQLSCTAQRLLWHFCDTSATSRDIIATSL